MCTLRITYNKTCLRCQKMFAAILPKAKITTKPHFHFFFPAKTRKDKAEATVTRCFQPKCRYHICIYINHQQHYHYHHLYYHHRLQQNDQIEEQNNNTSIDLRSAATAATKTDNSNKKSHFLGVVAFAYASID